MTVLVNSGTFIVVPSGGLTITANSTVLGELDGPGTVSGAFNLLVEGPDGSAVGAQPSGSLSIDTASFTNLGALSALLSDVTIAPSVNLTNLSQGTLTGGIWDTDNAAIVLPGGTITNDNATLELLLSGPILESDGAGGTQPIQNTLTEVGPGGILQLDSMGVWAMPGTFVDRGTVELDHFFVVGGDTFSAAGGITVTPGGVFIANGTIASPLTLNGTLEVQGSVTLLDGISGNGTIIVMNEGSPFVNDTTAAGIVSPALSIGAGVTIHNTGSVVSLAGGVATGGTGTNSGTVAIQTGNDLASIGVGTIASTFTGEVLFVGVNGSYDIYSPNFGELIVPDPGGFSGYISQFNNNDTIVLDGVIATGATLNGTILSVMNGASVVDSLTLVPRPESYGFANLMTYYAGNGQDYGGASFTATPDVAENDTTVTVSGIIDTPEYTCFLSGTEIATLSGNVPVEQLKAGDRVITLFGGARPVVWTGHRSIDCRRLKEPSRAWPVRVAPHAFGPDRPRRALFLSPDHAVFVEDVLIPVRYLIDGTMIRRVPMERVTYHHVELGEHDVVFAEGLATESFLDAGESNFFSGRGGAVRMFPDFSTRLWEMAGCAPLVVSGHVLARARAMLEDRAAGAEARAAAA